MSALPRSSEPRAPARRSPPALGRATAALVLVLQTVSLARPARAELPNPRVEAPATVEQGPVAAESTERATAQITLVGELADDRELSALIQELLERQAIRTELSRADRLEPDALFAARGRESLVLLAMTDPHHARLQFRGPNGERYLLRKLTLPGGLDVVGRELIAQVVESSVVALVRTTEGLSREEVTRELVREDAPIEPRPVEAPPRTSTRPTPPPASNLAWQPRVALRYAARWSGAALGVAHGPGIAIGARRGRAVLFGAELGVERSFTQTLSKSALSAEVQVSAAHALFELGLPLGRRHALWLALGPALELSRVSPVSSSAGVTLAAKQLDTVPAWRGELRYELSGDHFTLGAAVAVDVWLVRLHYELAGSKVNEELASPSLVHPGAALWLGVH